MKTLVLVLFVTLLGLGCSKDRDNTQVAQSNRVEPDNSGVNIRDRSDATKTPSDQSENETDRTITQKARDAITDDSSLSTNAKNIKFVTSDGVVTLRGPVKSTKEKTVFSLSSGYFFTGFQIGSSMQVRIFRRKYSSSRRP